MKVNISENYTFQYSTIIVLKILFAFFIVLFVLIYQNNFQLCKIAAQLRYQIIFEDNFHSILRRNRKSTPSLILSVSFCHLNTVNYLISINWNFYRKSTMNRLITLCFLILVIAAMGSQIKSQQSLGLTIYNDNFAMVKDVRKISLKKGQTTLYFTDVSANIQTETVTFKALKNPESVRAYQQGFDKNLVTTNGLLQKYIGQDIDLFVQIGTDSKKINGKLLGYNSGYILQTCDGIQVFNRILGIQFPNLPDGFFTTPTLNWKVWSEASQDTSCQVAYRTTGFRWSVDYSIVLNEKETKADIGGWVTIDNYSGKKYENAKLKLIAGDVNTVNRNYRLAAKGVAQSTNSSPNIQEFREKSFSDYHMYTLSKPVTLNQSSQKQLQFIPKVYNVPIDKYHEIRINAGGNNQENMNARNIIKFTNSKSVGLGIPFPKGTIRVFKQDKNDNSLQFIGENSINHTPKEESIVLNTGNAFDIVSKKIATRSRTKNIVQGYTANVTMTVNNHKNVEVDVVLVMSNLYGDNLNLTILNKGQQPQKISSRQYQWRKTIKANDKWQLSWKETNQ